MQIELVANFQKKCGMFAEDVVGIVVVNRRYKGVKHLEVTTQGGVHK